jgi:hypothetical protein
VGVGDIYMIMSERVEMDGFGNRGREIRTNGMGSSL